MNTAELPYWMTLAHLEGLQTDERMRVAVACYERGKKLSDFFNASDEEKIKLYGLAGNRLGLVDSALAAVPNYAFLAESLVTQGYDIITVWDERYPKSLKKHLKYHTPLILYTKGDADLLNERTIAIVGARNAEEKALAFTDRIARRKASEGYVIASGYAKGVDRQSLESALAADGKSIVVLPQGITTFGSGYKKLYKPIINGKVLVLSCFYPTAVWSVALAMARNSIVYALSEKIYVAESHSSGGTWNGVMDGLQREKKKGEETSIFVRVPEKGEGNANLSLIAAGAKAVDSQGNEVHGFGNEPTVITGKVIYPEPSEKVHVLAEPDVIDTESPKPQKTERKPRQVRVTKEIEDKIVELLSEMELRPIEILQRLHLDWCESKMIQALKSPELKSHGVKDKRRGKFKVYTIIEEPQLPFEQDNL